MTTEKGHAPVPEPLFARVDPAAAGMDPTAVAESLAFARRSGGYAVQIYRGGHLVGGYGLTGVRLPLASSSKGVAAVVVGRAIALGLFGIDDPIGEFFPDADAAHQAITVRQILTQSTGLHFRWRSDAPAIVAGDQVRHTLASPFDFEPGTTFQYAQAVLALLSKIIEVSSGADFQDFVQNELMDPIGITRARWKWRRDRRGNTNIAAGLSMRPDDLARIGHLLLREGRWQNKQLIDADYVRQARQPSETNGGYGFLMWVNAGDTYQSVEIPTKTYTHPVFPTNPRDTYAFSGSLGQFLVVIPSHDLVIVRLGVPTRLDLGPQAFLTGTANPDNGELFRRIANAVTV